MSRRPHIPLKRVIYVGCEGRSEAGYARLLQTIANSEQLSVHLHVEELHPGAGDPLARVEMAVQRLARLSRTRGAINDRFALLDFDQAEREPQRAERARQLAQANSIEIVWQRPTLEAVLLRHLPNRTAHRPPDAHAAMQALRRDWPDYEKATPAQVLATRIDRAGVLRAATVEPELEALLRCIGLVGIP